MDGQKKCVGSPLPWRSATRVAVFLSAILLGATSHAFAQAMGKVAVEGQSHPAKTATSTPKAPTAEKAPEKTPEKSPPTSAPPLVAPIPDTSHTTVRPTESRMLPSIDPLSKPDHKQSSEKLLEAALAVPESIAPVTTAPADSAPITVEPKTANTFEQRPIRSPRAQAEPAASTQATPNPASKLPTGVSSALQVAAALAVVLGLIFVGRALARKFVPGAKASNGKGVMEVLARYPLCKNQSIVLMRIGTQIIALNQGKDQSNSVLVVSDQEEVARIMGQIEGASPTSITAGFNRLLANARMDLEENDSETNNELQNSESQAMEPENLDAQLDEMAAAKRQLMDLRNQVRSVRERL